MVEIQPYPLFQVGDSEPGRHASDGIDIFDFRPDWHYNTRMMKQLATGIYTYPKLINGDFPYVDKTGDIDELIKPTSAQYFLPRLRTVDSSGSNLTGSSGILAGGLWKWANSGGRRTTQRQGNGLKESMVLRLTDPLFSQASSGADAQKANATVFVYCKGSFLKQMRRWRLARWAKRRLLQSFSTVVKRFNINYSFNFLY